MTPVILPLHFRKADFEAIYYKDNYHLIFKNPNTRNQALLAIVVGIAWLAVGARLLISGGNQTIFVVISILLAITAARLKKRTDSIKRWKKEIGIFLENLEKPTNRALVLSEEGFTFEEDNEADKIERWEEVLQADIEDDYISISASVDYLFPKHSMAPGDFEQLAAAVSRYVP